MVIDTIIYGRIATCNTPILQSLRIHHVTIPTELEHAMGQDITYGSYDYDPYASGYFAYTASGQAEMSKYCHSALM